MTRFKLTDLFTYRHRYFIGYVITILIFVSLLVVAGLYIPGGMSQGEMTQFIKTSSMDIDKASTLAIPNMPFFAVQRFSMDTLGLHIFTFKLPALICALFTGVGAVVLLRRWFRPNIAVLATIIMITTGQFIYVAQSGSADITYILWSVWLLLIATMVTYSEKHKRLWRLLLAIVIPLSLYTPMSIYLVLAVLAAGIFHPHVRHVIKTVPRAEQIILPIISISLSIPLLIFVIMRPALLVELLGAPASWPPDIAANLHTIFQQYFNFIHPSSGALMTPVLDLGSMILIAIGLWQQFKIRYTARSYTLTAWIILLVPVLIINPALISVTFVPLLLLLASGLGYILRTWYAMFPRNPYARFVGVVPLAILVGGLVLSGLYRYFDGYRYDPLTAKSFTKDISLYSDEILGKNVKRIVVAKDEIRLYNAVAKYHKEVPIKVSTETPHDNEVYAATSKAHKHIRAIPSKIITTNFSDDADRFYIYNN